MIQITSTISIDEDELTFDFVRASGPGGQNVNKVSSAVQLRFDVARSPSLSDSVKRRIFALAGKRVTKDGVLIIDARRHRTQEKNRDDAIGRLVELVKAAAKPPKKRRKTKPTPASRERRLEGKRRRGSTKRSRKPVTDDD